MTSTKVMIPKICKFYKTCKLSCEYSEPIDVMPGEKTCYCKKLHWGSNRLIYFRNKTLIPITEFQWTIWEKSRRNNA
jgi:hypothetical protein